ncbi:MAG: pilus assembly protein [Clostridiales bacterium GWE2_32_10]|nr:MAG: pilus assembly protein [Clostridiales bacterium GWE2_32_10]HBY19570.1 pilus assembly protein [Clostridiales bacterium]
MTEIINIIKNEVADTLQNNLNIDDREIHEIITNKVFEKSKDVYMKVNQKQFVIEQIYNSLKKLDVLQPYIENPEISEIMINGIENVFIEKSGEVTKTNINFGDNEKLEHIIQKIVSKVNRLVNEANPIVDARLEDGSRVSIVMPPIALNGPIVTIRKFSKQAMTIEDLVSNSAITEDMAKFLEDIVKARYNIFISGGTSSGKTTFLNALSNFIPSEERVITIEDSAELKINGIDNLVRLETRNKNIEGKGEVTIKDLIKTSLRMRPDRIIVGEVRGAEALDMLQAMNTGHDGSLSTGHANSTKDALTRLETMVLMGVDMPIVAIKQQITSAIDIVIHIAKLKDKSRRVLEISEVEGFENEEIVLNKIYEYTLGKDGTGEIIKVGNLVNDFKMRMNS